MKPFSRYYFLYTLATLMATCRINGNHSSQDNKEDGQRQRARRQLQPENQFQSDNSATGTSCGGTLTARRGVIQTPGFPGKFPVPITCIWVIDASEFATGINVSIVIYPTQLYVLSGLEFTEYMYYGDDFKVRSQRTFQFNEQNVTKVAWIQFHSQFLEISFTMKSLDGTHLRALDHLLDVYGFNFTYEVDVLKPYQCNALKCRFLGHCYADANFSSYYCSCFPGYSGSDCGQGPLCEDQQQIVCENGGTCKQVGTSAVTCLCQDGFKGNRCEIPNIDDNLGCFVNSAPECQKQCLTRQNALQSKKMCRCNTTGIPKLETSPQRNGKWRYQMTMRLSSNISSLLRDDTLKYSREHVKSTLERHVGRLLRNFNVTSFSDLELINALPDTQDITFHVFAQKSDSNRIHEAVSKMTERSRLGNHSILPNFLIFTEYPPFELQSIISNQPNPIRGGSEFILSCVARGSPDMTFRWYKDGFTVNISLASREIWTIILPPEHKNVYTSLLGIRSANKYDDGVYTCEVTDWREQKCRSTAIHVKSPPQLRIEPPSVTVYRGESVSIHCLAPESDHQRYGQFGYSWSRNGVLFQSNPKNITWEDLYPDGSILKIKSMQKSAEFTCIVSNNVAPISKSVHVMVIDRGTIELCPVDTAFQIKWPSSAPGPPIVMNCQKNYVGLAKRTCEQHDVGKANWLRPDFSGCVAYEMMNIHDEFQALLSGYPKTNCLNVLQACLEYARRNSANFYPGEANFLLDLLQEVGSYLQIKGSQSERDSSSEIMLRILDKIVQNPLAMNSLQQVKKFQLLTQNSAFNYEPVSASQLATSTMSETSLDSLFSSSSSASSAFMLSLGTNILPPDANTIVAPVTMPVDQITSFRIFKSPVKNLPFNMRIHNREIFPDIVNLQIKESSYILNVLSTNSLYASVIAYKNLTSFLPKRYFARSSDGNDVDYIPASRIVTSHLFQSNQSNESYPQLLNLPIEAGSIEIIFHHEITQIDTSWFPVCGHDSKSNNDVAWETETCLTKTFMENITRCICPLSGTFVVLLAKRNNNNSTSRASSRSVFVVISCCCCFLESCAAFIILIPILYNRKCCITFLKMQFCTSTSTVMAIFILGFLKMLPQDWHGIISSTLASLMLLALSSLVAIALVVQSELVPRKAQMANLSSGIKGAVCVSWLLPILFAICLPLIYTINGKWPISWWLESKSSGYILFITVETLFMTLFVMLFGILMKKLLYLAKKYDKKKISLVRRIGLLYRTSIIVILKTITDALFLVLPTQTVDGILSYVFGTFCILLGTANLICFVIKAESNIKSNGLGKQNSKGVINDIVCSSPLDHQFKFYCDQEIEKDYEKISPLAVAKLSTATPPNSRCHLNEPQNSPMQSHSKVVSCEDASGSMNNPHTMYRLGHSVDSNFDSNKVGYCDLLGKVGGDQQQSSFHESKNTLNRTLEESNDKSQNQQLEAIGVGTLDILKGVSASDSIIGIRSFLPKTVFSLETDNSQTSFTCTQTKSTISTQTPKMQKRVTIEEPDAACQAKQRFPNNHPFEDRTTPLPVITISPTVDEISVNQDPPHDKQATVSFPNQGTINLTSSEDPIDGMLHRISNDLNFLLNGAVDLTAKSRAEGLPILNESSMPTASSTTKPMDRVNRRMSLSTPKHICQSVHEAIIEEPEKE